MRYLDFYKTLQLKLKQEVITVTLINTGKVITQGNVTIFSLIIVYQGRNTLQFDTASDKTICFDIVPCNLTGV